MATAATERVVVLMAPQEKTRLEEKARRAGTSVGELVRRSVDAYEPEIGARDIEALLQLLEDSQRAAFSALDDAEQELAATRTYFEAKRRGAHESDEKARAR
jgi:hypothetical protein